MTNLIYQGKITRQFWGKLIRQSTIDVEKERRKIMDYSCLQYVTWGGAVLVKENVIAKLLSFIVS